VNKGRGGELGGFGSSIEHHDNDLVGGLETGRGLYIFEKWENEGDFSEEMNRKGILEGLVARKVRDTGGRPSPKGKVCMELWR